MMSFVRKAARSWVAGVFIALLVLSFAIWGINDVFSGASSNNVASVGKEGITAEQFKAEFNRVVKRASQDEKRTITQDEARKAGLDSAALERMVSEKAFAKLMALVGIKISDKTVRDEINAIPAFQDQSRRFSEAAYSSALQEAGMSVPEFEASVRNDLARQLMVLAGTSGVRAPKVFSSQTLAFATERRTVTMIPVPARLAGAPPVPTEAQLIEFYNKNREKLMRPETRDLTLVVTSLDDFVPKATIDEARVQQLFNTNKDKLATPAKRSFVQIVAPNKAKADEAAQKLRAGEAAENIAKALGLQAPLTFTDATASQIPDRKIGDAVLSSSTGTIAVVQGDLAFAAIQITAAKDSIAARFEDFAPKVRENMKKEAAAQLMTEATDNYDKAISTGENIESAAGKSGFKVIKLQNIMADGKNIQTGEKAAQFTEAEAVLTDAFQIGQGDNTDLSNAGPASYIAVRVDKITAKAPVPLNEVRQELTRAWVGNELSVRLKARANQILADAKATSIEAAATKAGLSIVRAPQPLMRGQGSPELSAAIFGAKVGEIVSGPVANGVEFAIVKIESIIRDDENKAPERLQQAEQEVRRTVQSDIVSALNTAARNRSKAKIFTDRMKTALGDTIDPNTAKK